MSFLKRSELFLFSFRTVNARPVFERKNHEEEHLGCPGTEVPRLPLKNFQSNNMNVIRRENYKQTLANYRSNKILRGKEVVVALSIK